MEKTRRYRGRAVEPRPKREPGGTRGRPPIHPPEDCKRTMVRSTDAEASAWEVAAEITERRLGLSRGALTIGPWARRVLNEAAKRAIEGDSEE